MTRLLGWLALLGLSLGLVLGLGYAPREVTQGNVQRIMYLHVPSVLTAYIAFAVVFLGSIAFLLSQRRGWDRLAWASAELGVLFTGLTLASGAIWGKPTWGTWWTWDARLTTTAILFVIYVGYLLLRGMVEDRERGARYAAVLGILGFLDIPVVHFSVKWWRTLHQPSTLLGPEPSPISPSILAVLLVNLAAFLLLYGYFLAKRLSLFRLEEELQV
jgi:heme exporter protein C